MRRRIIAVTASAAALAAGWTALPALQASVASSAAAAGNVTVVVRGVDLPVTGRTQVAVVGCTDVFAHSAALAQPMMGISPKPAPAGARSLAFAPAPGDAVGPLSYVDRVAATSVAQMSVLARTGGAGVAYVGYQSPADAGTSTMWIGRADLSAEAGRWTTLDATRLAYSWARYDLATQLPAATDPATDPASDPAPVPATVAAFVSEHGGDGYGFYALGLGCDGALFNTDAWRIGSPGATTTYDFEGYPTATSIAGPDAPVDPGTPVTLTGQVTDASGAALEGWAVLERRGPGGWVQVDGADASGATLQSVVTPDTTTTYRWRTVDRARYEGSVSAPFTVRVQRPAPPAGVGDPPPAAPGPTMPTPPVSAPAVPEVPGVMGASESPTRAAAPAPSAEAAASAPSAPQTSDAPVSEPPTAAPTEPTTEPKASAGGDPVTTP